MNKLGMQIATWWCKLVHAGVMWPAHGHYRCRGCHRLYSVPWGETA